MALHRSKERALVAQTILGLVKSLATARRDTANSTDLLLIGCAILVGEDRGRLMGASDIAKAIGIPRSTVIRKLHELTGRGMVIRHGTKYQLADMPTAAADAYLAKAQAIIRDAAHNLK